MNILAKIRESVENCPERAAFISRYGKVSYKELWTSSDKLAAWLESIKKDDKRPIVVYGHKNPYMLVCFLACVKSGRAYCPVDISVSEERIKSIIEKIGNDIVLATEMPDIRAESAATAEAAREKEDCAGPRITGIEKIKEIIESDSVHDIFENTETGGYVSEPHRVSPNDIFYIIFTSGSTGMPKGVEITDGNLSRFTDWSEKLVCRKKDGTCFLNQAPFSFDLSVMDIYTALATGARIVSVDKELQGDVRRMISFIADNHVDHWVSTPSFADLCLSDRDFDRRHLKDLTTFLFCGEKLTLKTAREIKRRFPEARIVNTYGPTETTVAVTSVEVTDDMLKADDDLPVGYVKPGTHIKILDADGMELGTYEKGEILIIGDTVSPGYFKDPEKTNRAFCEVMISESGVAVRQTGQPKTKRVLEKKTAAYKTGDIGYIDEKGMLYICGRTDLQIKLHGYRIELEDIERNIVCIDGVTAAAVLPRKQDDRIRYLTAFVVAPEREGNFTDRKWLRIEIRKKLPDYMVPKKIVFIDSMPLTGNGKTDRKKLEERL